MQRTHPEICSLGGSVGLILLGVIPERQIGDLDVVFTTDFYNRYEGKSTFDQYLTYETVEGVKFNYIVNIEEQDFDLVPVIISFGFEMQTVLVKVHKAAYAMMAKVNYLFHPERGSPDGKAKHKADLLYWLNNLDKDENQDITY